MGCTPEQQPCNINYGATRLVRLNPFWIARYEVTQSQWLQVMGNNPSFFTNCGLNCPVENICFFDCITFCNRLSIALGFEPCYYSDKETSIVFDSLGGGGTPSYLGGYASLNHVHIKETANGFRMLFESEWECAARGGNNLIQTTFSGSNNADSVSWNFNNNALNSTKPVGTKIPNYLGIFDMTGNVNEYIFDFGTSLYSETPPYYINESCRFIFTPQFGYYPINGYPGWSVRGGDYNDTPNQVSWRSGGLCQNSITMAGRGLRLARNAD